VGYTLFQPRRRSQSPEQDSNLRFLDYSRCSSAITFRAKRTVRGSHPLLKREKGNTWWYTVLAT